MKITKKDLEKRQVELTIELSVDELKPYLDKAAKKISQQVDIPGFRKGKIPYDVLKQNVGEATIYEEAFYDAVQETLPKAVEQEKLEVIGQPKVDIEKVAPGNPVSYKAVLSLMPNIKLGDYKTLKAKRKKVEVDEKKVAQTFEDLKKMRAQEKLVNREAKNGDKVEINFEIKQSGVVIEGGQGQKYPLMLGENKFIPGFEDQVVGMKKDQEKEFPITFPKDYFEKKLQGRKCDVKTKVLNVYELTLPEINDEFAKSFNFKSKAEFEEKIKENINKEVEQKEKERLELSILEEIMEKSTFDEFPATLIDSEMDKMWHELKHNVEDSGGKMEDYLKHIGKTEEEIKKDMKPQADKRIKTALISRAIAEAEKIEVSDKEAEEEIKKQTEPYKDNPEVQKQIQSDEYKRYVKNLLANKKTFELLESFVKD